MENIVKLQRFAEEEAAAETAPETPATEPERKYTDADVDAIIKERLTREREKQERERKEAQEAEKFKAMTQQQKVEARIQKMEKELAGYKQRETESQMTTVAREAMNEAGISVPDSILKHLIAQKAEDTKTNVDGFIKAFNEAVGKQVASKLTRNEPKVGLSRPGAELTRKQIMETKDPLTRQKLIAENPDLFPELG